MSVQPPGPVIEKGSYIPRVTLVAEGWTNFPPDSPGLQVAVRGNLMPGSKPGGEKRTKWWSDDIYIAKLRDYFSNTLGSGKSNMAFIKS